MVNIKSESFGKIFMGRFNIIFLITFILAFCSIVYELLLAQSLSAFLENTVLRYSVTIGLYMFSMGFGALMAEGRFIRNPVLTLLRIEILLTVIGGFAVVLLHLLNMSVLSRLVFSLLVHGLIVLIGVLTGFEIPLLIEIRNREKERSENAVLGVDYFGAVLGTIIFAFVFYPVMGLIPTAFFVGSLNAGAGILLFTQREKVKRESKSKYYIYLSIQAVLLVIIIVCLVNSGNINSYFINHYLRG